MSKPLDRNPRDDGQIAGCAQTSNQGRQDKLFA